MTPANNPVLINEKAGFLTFDAVAALRVTTAAVRDCKRYVLVAGPDPAGRSVTNKVHHAAAARHTLEQIVVYRTPLRLRRVPARRQKGNDDRLAAQGLKCPQTSAGVPEPEIRRGCPERGKAGRSRRMFTRGRWLVHQK